jgi:hypothetical protein
VQQPTEYLAVRLTQTAYHNRSLCLYTSLGFQTREPLSLMQAPPLKLVMPAYYVRPAHPSDVDACRALSQEILGFDRRRRAAGCIEGTTATVVEHLIGQRDFAPHRV